MIIAGVEIHRFGLQDELLALAEGSQIPITTTMLGKSIISETHPLFVGIYEGAMGNDEVTRFVEESDCVLLLGTFMTDINLGIYTAQLDPAKCIYATSEQLRIRPPSFSRRAAARLYSRLAARCRGRRGGDAARAEPGQGKFGCSPTSRSRISRLIPRLNESLDETTIVIADIGDALFAASELVIRGRRSSSARRTTRRWASAVPAALGAMFARPDLARWSLVGDGAFQMTGIGAVDARAAQVCDHRHRAGQPRLRHRAAPAPGQHSSSTKSTPGSTTSCPRSSAAEPATWCEPKATSTQALTSAWDDTGHEPDPRRLDRDDHSPRSSG